MEVKQLLANYWIKEGVDPPFFYPTTPAIGLLFSGYICIRPMIGM
jgi:hypothetical protein